MGASTSPSPSSRASKSTSTSRRHDNHSRCPVCEGWDGWPRFRHAARFDEVGRAVDDLPGTFLVALNAGGLFHTGRFGGLPVIRNLARVNSLLYRQSTALRRREMIDRFKAFEKAKHEGQPPPEWGRQGVLFELATTFDEPSAEWVEGRPEHEELRLKLALVKTTFARFPHELCEQLIYRGWWLAGCSIATYHRDLINQLPHWRDLPPLPGS